MFFTLVSLFLMTLLPACIERPDGMLSEDETVDLLTDMQLAEAYLNQVGPSMSDSARRAMAEGVLLRHGVTKDQLDKTLAYYGKNADEYVALFDKVNKRIDSRRNRLTGKISNESKAENNIWPYSPFALFSRNGSSDGIVFSLDGEAMDPGEQLEWKLRMNNNGQADALLGVEYIDGSSTYVKRSIGGNRNVKIDLQSDTGKIIKRVFGYFNVNRSVLPLWVDSISLMRMPFDSLNYSKGRGQSRYYGPRNRPKDMKPDTISTETPQTPDTPTPQSPNAPTPQTPNTPTPQPPNTQSPQRPNAPNSQRPGGNPFNPDGPSSPVTSPAAPPPSIRKTMPARP